MAQEFATVDELQARLDWVLDEHEQGVAAGALADLSEDARYYGLDLWDSFSAPRQAKSLVLRAAARYMRNPDGYTQSRAGDETLAWTDLGENAGAAYFNSREQKMLADLAGRSTSGLHVVPLVAWGNDGNPDRPGYVEVEAGSYGAGEPRKFPLYSERGW